jgi:alkanesulfonate monooxygenase SsuD/methylene tetrahydromethanopterin reductase-like flavin-dependent oxidoreductase (luciferase family)
MKYGITLDRDGVARQPAPLKYLTDFAREAERMGCAYVVIGDRLESGVDPFLLLTAIAEASGSMWLVTSVVILPPRGILVTAKQFAALDVLTGGRIVAGVGTGSLFRDYEIVGLPADDMRPRFEEGVQAMRAYLTPDAPPFKGRFYDTTGVNLEPKPVQQPCLPIWIFPNAVSTMALFVSDDPAELAQYGGPGYVPRPAGVGVEQPEKRPADDRHAHDMVGTRATCINKVRRWKAAGAQGLFLVPRGPDPLGQMRRFLDEVASQA